MGSPVRASKAFGSGGGGWHHASKADRLLLLCLEAELDWDQSDNQNSSVMLRVCRTGPLARTVKCVCVCVCGVMRHKPKHHLNGTESRPPLFLNLWWEIIFLIYNLNFYTQVNFFVMLWKNWRVGYLVFAVLSVFILRPTLTQCMIRHSLHTKNYFLCDNKEATCWGTMGTLHSRVAGDHTPTHRPISQRGHIRICNS